MDREVKILIVEDEIYDVELNIREISKVIPSFQYRVTDNENGFLYELNNFDPDIVVTDYMMPDFNGMTVLKLTLELAPLTPVIVVTGSINEEVAVDCMLGGASNYVIKEHIIRLGTAVSQALKERTIAEDKAKAKAELKKKQKELIIAKERAEEGDRLKTAFLQNLSHEIRTPMNGIIGFTNLLKDKSLTDEVKDECVYIIEKSCLRLMNVIDNLVDVSRIEAGQLALFPEYFDVNEVVKDLHAFFVTEATGKKIILRINKLLPDNEKNVLLDKSKFSQILTNLIKNAI